MRRPIYICMPVDRVLVELLLIQVEQLLLEVSMEAVLPLHVIVEGVAAAEQIFVLLSILYMLESQLLGVAVVLVVILVRLALLVEEYQVKRIIIKIQLMVLATLVGAVAKLRAVQQIMIIMVVVQEALGKVEIIPTQVIGMAQEAVAAGMAAVVLQVLEVGAPATYTLLAQPLIILLAVYWIHLII